jgi:hypothetical protein
VAPVSPSQQLKRRRLEALISLAAPVLDLVLAAGERLSRLTGGADYEHYPIRSPGEALPLSPPASRPSDPPAA